MTVKKLLAATALIAGVTLSTAGASFAQIYYGGPYGYEGGPYGYGYQGGPYGYGSAPDWARGGPGPRVQDGSGMGVGGVR
jgi:hypothetical protein